MSDMQRPVLDFADVLYPGLRDKKVSECTPEESIVAGIAWMADNSEYGIDDAARKLIEEFRRYARSESERTTWKALQQDFFEVEQKLRLSNYRHPTSAVMALQRLLTAATKDPVALIWAAKWIEGSVPPDADARFKEFAANMAMTIRAEANK